MTGIRGNQVYYMPARMGRLFLKRPPGKKKNTSRIREVFLRYIHSAVGGDVYTLK